MSEDSVGNVYVNCGFHVADENGAPLRVGQVLRGFCGGVFGRESYGDKVVEAIGGDWVVAREDNGDVVFARVDPDELCEYR